MAALRVSGGTVEGGALKGLGLVSPGICVDIQDKDQGVGIEGEEGEVVEDSEMILNLSRVLSEPLLFVSSEDAVAGGLGAWEHT